MVGGRMWKLTLSAAFLLSVTFIAPLWSGGSACADDSDKPEPHDGLWAAYHWRLTSDDSPNGQSGSLTIKFLGPETVGQTTCRWMEHTFVYNKQGNRKQSVVIKLLVNEEVVKSKLAGKREEFAIEKRRPVKAWIKLGDAAPKKLGEIKLNDFAELADLTDKVSGEFPPTPLRGEVKNSRKEIAAKTVSFQKGRIECKGYRTRSLREFDDGKLRYHTTRSVWVTDGVPFGFTRYRIDRKREVDGETAETSNVIVSLQDFGTGAKSALPDCK